MKSIMLFGLFFIVLGIGALAYRGITVMSRPKIVNISSIQAGTDTKKTILLFPISGSLSIVGGIALLISGRQY